MPCLQVKVTVEPLQVKLTASLICGFGKTLIPLLVDEGYLFVEENGVISFLTVKK